MLSMNTSRFPEGVTRFCNPCLLNHQVVSDAAGEILPFTSATVADPDVTLWIRFAMNVWGEPDCGFSRGILTQY